MFLPQGILNTGRWPGDYLLLTSLRLNGSRDRLQFHEMPLLWSEKVKWALFEEKILGTLGRGRRICRMSPENRAFFIGVLEYGRKERQTRLGVERKWGKQNSRYGKGVAVQVAQFWLLKTLVVYVFTI